MDQNRRLEAEVPRARSGGDQPSPPEAPSFRAHNDHPDFPDSISIIGDTDGLQWHYFDSRGVHRVYEFRVTDDGWEIARDAPQFSQRLTVMFEDDDNTMAGRSILSLDDETGQDDLQITYRRSVEGE